MKKTYRMTEVDCANCARKMEDAIRKLDGVTTATVSFLTQKLTIEMDEAKEHEILSAARKCVKNIDADCDIIM